MASKRSFKIEKYNQLLLKFLSSIGINVNVKFLAEKRNGGAECRANLFFAIGAFLLSLRVKSRRDITNKGHQENNILEPRIRNGAGIL